MSPFYRYIKNTYQKPAKLVVNDTDKTDFLLSEEGCTQGDVAAMAFYALGVHPLTTRLSTAIDKEKCKQAWYADDSSAMGKLLEMRKWWDLLCQYGP